MSLTYYGQRMVTANKEIKKPEDMKGMKLRVPPAPLFLMFTKSVGANATPIAFAEVYLALQQGTVDGQENPLPTIMAKKFYEVQSHIMLTGHITEIAAGDRRQSRVVEARRRREEDRSTRCWLQAAAKATDQIRALGTEAGRRIPQARQDRRRRRIARPSAPRLCRCTMTAAAAGARPNTTPCRP